MKKKILYILIAIVIIIGAIICKVKGFNFELGYSNRQEMMISIKTELDMSKIKEIVNSVIQGRRIKIQKVERFGNAVQIISTEISDEEKNNIIDKVNEAYNDNISSDDINIIDISNTRIRDILKPYIIPGVVTIIVVLIYFLIVYNKLGIVNVTLKSLLVPIVVELTYYSLVAISRVPFGRITSSIALGLYVISIFVLTIYFQRQKQTNQNKTEGE